MALAARAFGAFLKLPPALTRAVTVHRDVAVTAPDGVRLLADLYQAQAAGPLPAILIRSPYGRRSYHGLAARAFAERGYHALVQSTRGTAGSGGAIDFDAEAGDGRAAADWITGQPWSNGEIGTFGSSYLAFTQYALASTRPPQLKAMAVAVWGADRRAGYYPGGSFALGRALSWTWGMNLRGRSPLAMIRERGALQAAFGHLPLLDADVVATGRPARFYRDWLEHDDPGDPYWTATDFRAILPGLGVPVTMTAGWYDPFLPLMLADYAAIRAGGQPVRLRIGAWRHSSPALFRQSLRDALDWFSLHLRYHTPDQGHRPIGIEVTGGAGWRQVPGWPPAATVQRWHLRPGQGLSPAPPAPSPPDRYRYDPAEPTPAVGGTSSGRSAGPQDNRELEARPDVLTFSSGPLDQPVEITGPVRAELYVTSSLRSTDFFARLCDVDPRGRPVNVTDGLIRLTGAARHEAQLVAVDLWPAAHRFRAGHQIRLQVSSGAHPRFARNPGSGEPLATATTLRVAEQTVHHDPDHPSAVLLPVTGPATGLR